MLMAEGQMGHEVLELKLDDDSCGQGFLPVEGKFMFDQMHVS